MRNGPLSELQRLAFAGHGGNLNAARLAYPQAPEPWLDLSTGINPYPYLFAELPPECATRLPEPQALCALEQAAASSYHVPATMEVIAAPGTQAIINWLPYLLPARRVGILGFTYSEYARSWAASGAEVTIVEDLAGLADKDVAIIVNPNNPDGRRIAACELHALAAAMSKHDGLLIVDEAFIDFLEPGASVVLDMPARGIVALRSFGKTFGLPGLRLGFAIAPTPLAEKLRAALGPWPVSGAAIAIGSKALLDKAWLASTRAKLEVDAAALEELLVAAGFASIGGGCLFQLVRHVDAQSQFEHLAERGILVRRFEAHPTWLRFGTVRSDGERARLRTAVSAG